MITASLTDINTESSAEDTEAAAVRNVAAQLWAKMPLLQRVAVLRRARHQLADETDLLAQSISTDLVRTSADTKIAEILPLLSACAFLERNARQILAPRRLGRGGLPFWLSGVVSEVHRVSLGHVLVIGPANYPLFLPGVQTLQALAAGNSVTWKPGRGGYEVAKIFAKTLQEAGLPSGVLHITSESVEAVDDALAERPAKVFFTGSAEVGRLLMHRLTDTLTPSVMELSGCDAVIVLPSANLSRVVKALVFGMRLNGSATCMAPRRVLLIGATSQRRGEFISQLLTALRTVEPIVLPASTRTRLTSVLNEASAQGAYVHGIPSDETISPIVVTDVRPEMRIAQADIFAPVLSIIDIADQRELLVAQETCPFALTAAIFGDELEASRLAKEITAGSILINDIIVPTADPRMPFGGRRQSGFGVTRGAEGLLEMTAIKTFAVRRGSSERHYEKTTNKHEHLFDGLIAMVHGGTWAKRWQGMKQVASAGKRLREKGEGQHGSW